MMNKINGEKLFFIAQTICILLIGLFLKTDIKDIILMWCIFVAGRSLIPNAMHYDEWYKCASGTTFLFFTLFLIAKVDVVTSILMCLFSVIMLTDTHENKNIYLWNGKNSKYKDVEEFIKYNSYDDKLLEFEKKLEEQSKLEYLIFKYRFREHKTFAEISELLDMETPRVSEKIDKIGFALRLYCKI